jgi:hypothetical protein
VSQGVALDAYVREGWLTAVVGEAFQGKMRVSRAEAAVLRALVVFAAAVVAGGLTSSYRSLRQKWDAFGYPFECHCLGPACP